MKCSQTSRVILRWAVLIGLLGSLGLSAVFAQGIIIPIGPGCPRSLLAGLASNASGQTSLPPGP